MVAAGNPLTINVFITVISFKVISKSTKHVPLTTLYTTVPALTQSVLMVAFPEYGLTIPFPIKLVFNLVKLVLNTLRKMHKSEFWMNFYTDGRNTNLTGLNARFHFDRVAIMQPFFDDTEKSFGFRLYYDASMTAGYAIHFYYNGEKRITLRFLDIDGVWKNSWTGLLQ